MQLILVSPPEIRKDETKTVSKMFEEGLQYFHLRKPEASVKEAVGYLKEIPEEFHSRIILHNQLDIAEHFQLKGIHFNSVNISYLKDYFQVSGIRSYSARDFEDMHSFRNKMDYVMLSPGFTSLLRRQSTTLLMDQMETMMRRKDPSNLVALGGVSKENIIELKELGFWGAGVLNDIWHTSNTPEDMVRKVKFLLDLLEDQEL